MRKPASLRKHLEAYVDWLKKHPDKLVLRVANGHISTKNGVSLSFEWRYTLEVLVMDVAHPPEEVVVPILAWLTEHQPDLYERLQKILNFEAEPVNHDAIDLLFKLDLSEAVIVHKKPGGYRCEHVDEPRAEDFEGDLGWKTLGHAAGTTP